MTEGIYTAYMTSSGGNGFVMFVFDKGKITGADPLGVLFDGTYEQTEDKILGDVEVRVPPNGSVIQGATAGPAGMNYSVKFDFPLEFWKQEFVEVQTPLGPVNARFERIRELNSVE